MNQKRILILGANGMLGNGLMRFFCKKNDLQVIGVSRSNCNLSYENISGNNKLLIIKDISKYDCIRDIISKYRPDIVINCIGLIKQSSFESSLEDYLLINGLFPHQLEVICSIFKSRLIQFSTDCVFNGLRGGYTESDFPDAEDDYGLSKRMGEIVSSQDVLTIRTSIIGHELNTKKSLLEWFLSQEGSIPGYANVIFSGFPVNEIGRILYDFVFNNQQLFGLFHISSDPISKLDLLCLIAMEYDKRISIVPNYDIKINRSLISDNFRRRTGFTPRTWIKMIKDMAIFG